MRAASRALRMTAAVSRHPRPPVHVFKQRPRPLTSVREEFQKRERYNIGPSFRDHLKRLSYRLVRLTIGLYVLYNYAFINLPGADIPQDDESHETSQVDDEEKIRNFVIPDKTPDQAVFLPLGPPREIERQARDASYVMQDPAYMEVATFCFDKHNQRDVVDQVISQVISTVSQARNDGASLGGQLRCSRAWIDLLPDRRKPKEYQRLGIEHNQNSGITYPIRRTLNAIEAQRVMNILFPAPLLALSNDFMTTLFNLKWPKIEAAFAAATRWAPQGSPEVEVVPFPHLPGYLGGGIDREATAAAVKKAADIKRGQVPGPSEITKIALPGASTSSTKAQPTQTPASSQAESSDTPQSNSEDPTFEDAFEKLSRRLVSPWQHGSDLSKAAHDAFGKYTSRIRDCHNQRIEGDASLRGVVEITGTTGRIAVQVHGYFNTQTKDLRLKIKPIMGATWSKAGKRQT